MIHCFKYNHKGRDYHFLWDNESGSLHNVDKAAYLVAKNKYEKLEDNEVQEFQSLPDNLILEIQAEFDELASQGAFNTPAYPYANDKQIGEIKALCLHICHDCNLRCKYCFAGDGKYHSEFKEYMSFEVGKKAIDFLIANSGKRKNLEVDFFGGEPLMNLDIVKQIVAYAREEEKKADKTFNFTLTTNCLLLNDETIEWLNKEMYNVVLSIDGREKVHDRLRLTANGKGSQAIVLEAAKKFAKKRGNKSYYVRGTFTAYNLDFVNDILYLRDQGFDQISVEPVVLKEDSPMAIKEEHLPQILAEYEKLAREYLESRANGKWFNFFHFMLDLEGGPCIKKRLTGCGAGCEYLAITPYGDIYPCHQFAGETEYKLGNVLENNFCLDISKKFAKNIVTNKPQCEKCPAKYYCSGGCAANNIHFAGDLSKPYSISCEMMKKRFELSLAISAVEQAGVVEN